MIRRHNGAARRRRPEAGWRLESLERRILFSADLPLLSGPLDEAGSPPIVGSTVIAEDAAVNVAPLSLLVLDPSADGFDALRERLYGLDDGNWRGLVLDAARDGVAQISEILADQGHIGGLHIVTSGSGEAITLGNASITFPDLLDGADSVAGWRDSLDGDGSLQFYGVDVGDADSHLLATLSDLVGVEATATPTLPVLPEPVTAGQPDAGTVRAEDGEQARLELVFVDADTPDYQTLLDDLTGSEDAGRHFEVIVLDGERDGVLQIGKALQRYQGVDAVHVISHGSEGAVALGRSQLSSATLAQYSDALRAWSAYLSDDADILLYGCDVAATTEGRQLIDGLAALTGADIAASDDLTGHVSQGGDWDLEYRSGDIDTNLAVTAAARDSWDGVLDMATLNPDQDTYIQLGNSSNYGASSSLVVDRESTDLQRALLQFDLSGLPNNILVTSATLHLEATQIDGALNIGVYEMLSAWSGGSANWTQSSSGTNWTSAGGDYNSTAVASLSTNSTGDHTWDITSLVQDWVSGAKVNNGVMVASPDGGGNRTVTYDSAEGTVAPQLIITYTVLNEAPVNTVPGTQTTAIDSPVVFSTGNGNAISVSDTDDGSLEVTLTATNGTLTLASLTGLSFSSGDGVADASMTFTGALTDINAALEGLQFDPNASFEGYAGLQISTTDFGGSGGSPETDVDAVSIEVGDVNSPPVNMVPGAQTVDVDGMLLFSTANGTAISIGDPDAGGSSVQVALTATNGKLNLPGTQGLSFSTGDGTDDATMVFTGTVADVNAALEGMTFVATPGFSGSAGVQISTNDLGNTGSGGPQSDVDSVAITVQAVNQALWMTFENDEAGTGNPEIPSITGGDVVTFGSISQLETSNSNPLAATTSGTFSATFNLDTVLLSDGVTLASDGNTRVNAVHRVSSDMTVGGIQLQAGDLLLSTNEAETIGGVAYAKEDVFVFRPDTDGDYSQGSFFRLIDGKNDTGWGNVSAISLVEQTTVVGGVTLNAGDFLFAHDGSGKNILRFAPTTLGDTTSGTTSVLVAGADIDIGQNIGGLHLVQNDTVLGGVSLTAGQLLVSLTGNDSTVGDGTTIDVKRQDVFVLDVTATGTGTTAATASRLFEGLDESLDNNNESIWGLSLESNAAPVVSDAAFTLDENSAAATVVGTVSATDPEGGAVRYAITAGNTGGAFAIDAATGQITVANSAALDFETTPSFSLTIAAIDAQGAHSNATVTVDLNDVPEAPVFTSPATFSHAENGTAVGTVTTSDPDGGVPQYTLVGADDDALFSIDVNTGALSFNAAPDFESPADGNGDNVYQLTVQADDGNGGIATQLVTVTVTDVNDAPTTTGITDFSLNEDPGFSFIDLNAVFADQEDPDAALVYTITGNSNPALFDATSINGSGVLSLDYAADQNGFADITVRATDTGGEFVETTFRVTVNPVNDAPVRSAGTVTDLVVVEDSGVTSLGLGGVAYGPGGGSDESAQTLSYEVTVIPDPDAFGRIYLADGTTQVSTGAYTLAEIQGMQFAPAPDATGGPSFFSYRVVDSGGTANGGSDTLTETIRLDITPVNDAPVIDLDADDSAASGSDFATTFSEGGPAVAIADADATLVDVDHATLSGLTVTITNLLDGTAESLSADTTGTGIVAAYDSGTGVLTLSGNDSAANYQQVLRTIAYANTSEDPDTTARQIQFLASDGSASSNVATATVSIVASNDDPVFTSPNAFNVAENGAAVGTVTTTDVDGGAPQYSLVGAVDDALFSIDASTGALTFNAAPDFEAPADAGADNVYDVTVQVDDGNGGIVTQNVSITVSNVNETGASPIVDSDGAANVVSEDASVGSTVGITAFSDDADIPDTVSYSLDDDAGGLFAIDAVTGVVTVNGALDAETATSHDITIRATSTDGSSSTSTLSIAVSDVDEFDVGAVTDTDAAANSVDEDAAVGTVVGVTASAGDADVGDSVTYSLDDDAGGLFAIDAATGVVTVNGALDYETATSHSVTVRATSTDGSFSTQAFTIDVVDVNESTVGAISDTDATADSVAEDASVGTSVGVTALADDPDGTDTVAYSLDDDAGGLFAIDGATGIVTVNGALDAETATSHDIIIRATSTDGSFSTTTRSIAVSDVDEFNVGAVSDSDGSANSAAEDAAIGTAVGITALADDLDVTDAVSYSLDDDVGGLFAIDSVTGVVTVNGALDYETATSHTVTVRATSTDGSFSTQAFTINVVDVNESGIGSVTDTDAASDAVAENAGVGASVGITAQATDSDGTDTVSYSLDDDAGGLFVIDSATGVVTVNGALDAETAASHDIIIRATSTDGSFSTTTLAIAVSDVDEFDVDAVTDTDGGANSVAEDAAVGTAVGVTASASDADVDDSVSYSLDDDAGGLFAIDSATGVVTVNGALDYEATASHSVTVRATSTDGSFSTQSFTIDVVDINESGIGAISDTDASLDGIAEDAAVGTAVGVTAYADDPDGTDIVSYSLDNDAGGLFAIDGATGVVTVNGALDAETVTSHDITIRATSTDGSFSTTTLSIAVSDVDEFDVGAVTDNDGTANSVAEDATVGTVVGMTAFAADADVSDSVTYSLVDDAGGLFAIDSATGVVTVNGALDFETATSHSVTVRATSTDGSFSTQAFTIDVVDVNESTIGAISDTDAAPDTVAEDAAIGTSVGVTAFADDPDGSDTVTYSLDDDAGGLFAIDGATGVVTVNGALDAETATSHNITIRATSTDGSFSTTTLAIAVSDVDEFDVGAVTDTDGAADSVAEDAAVGTSAGITASASDADVDDTVSYSLDDDAGGLFAIDGVTGVVTINGALDAETATSHNITIRATSTDGSFSTTTLAVAVSDVDEFDVGSVADTDGSANSVAEDAVVGTAVGITASASDDDVDDTVSYSLDDDAGGLFAIDGVTGVVTVNGALDYENATSYSVTVRATSTDGSFSTQSFTIDVVDVNESAAGAISDTDALPDAVAEDAAVWTAVGVTAFADDSDGTDSVSYSLDDDAGGLFAIDGTTGVVTVNGSLDAESATSHDITIRATSTDGSFSTTTLTIAVSDVDEFDVGAVSDADAAANSVAENAAVGAAVGIAASATDADVDDIVSYSLDDDAGGLFAIDSATGVVTVNGALDYETATSHSVTVRATSTDGSFSTQAFTIDVVDVNESSVGAIVDSDAAADTVAEDAGVGSSVGITAYATDPDGTDTVSYSLDNDAGGLFAIDAVTGAVTVNGALDAETATSHDITIRATSTDGSFSTTTLAITVSDVDEFDVGAVTDSDGAADSVAEDAAVGTAVGVTALADDADVTDTVTYTLDDDAGGLFAIDSASGVVTVDGSLDYETTTSHSVTVRATSTDGSFSTQVFTIDVQDVNESGVGAITDTDAAADTIAEDAAVGVAVGVTAYADDPDGTDTVSYSLDDDAGGLFAIDAATGVVTVNGALDAETATSHDITIRATSTDGSFSTTILSIAVSDVDEFDVGAVSDTNPAANSVDEDASVGTAVGITASASDADVSDSVTYTLDDDAGGLFAIDSVTGVVTVNGALDYETANSHSVTVRATSTDGSFSTQSFTIDMVDVNESAVGVISDTDASSDSIAEDAAVGTAVGVTAYADDPDGTDTVSYSLDDDAGGLFAIDSATGIVTLNGTLDAETATSHDITVRATSSDGSFSTTTLAIAVSDVNEFDIGSVTDTDGAANSVAESASVGTAVGITASASDADVSDSVTYTLDDAAGGLFAIDSATGMVTVNGSLDYETATSHSVTVRATSTDGSFSTQAFTIDVVDVNESAVGAISDTDAAPDTVAEDAAVGTAVGVTAYADDPDGTDTVSYSLDDDAGGLFAIDAVTGSVTLNGPLDFESATSHDIVVRALSDDGSTVTRTFTILVGDVNDTAPVIIAGQTFSVGEDATAGAVVGTAAATDADTVGSLQGWTITGGNAAGIFAIDAVSGQISVVDPSALDHETTSQYTLSLQVSDGVNTSAVETVVIDVQDVNEAPLFTSAPVAAATEDTAYLYAITTSDPESDPVSIVASTLPAWLTLVDNGDGTATLSGTPGNAEVGDHTVVLEVTDGPLTTTQTFTVTVSNVNDAPVVTSPEVFAVAENTTLVGTVTSSDVDGGAPQYSLVGSADDALFSIDASTGALSFLAAPDFEAPADTDGDNVYQLTVQVEDGNGGTATQALSVTVTDANDSAPVVTAGQAFAVAEDAAAATPVGTVAATDADTVGSLQGWTIIAGNADGIFAIDTVTGEISVADPTSLDYESTPQYTLTVQVSDGVNTALAETVVVSVTNVNEPPMALLLDNASLPENTNTAGGYRVGMLSATDPDAGDTVSYQIVGGLDADVFAIGGGAADELFINDGVLDYERQAVYEVRVRATDASGSWSETTLSIAVGDLDEPPIAADDALTTSEDEPLTVSLTRLLGNDSDPEGGLLTVTDMEQPANGVLMDNLDGTWTYLPDQNFNGTDQFRYQVSDAGGAGAWSTVTVQVLPVNDAPLVSMTSGPMSENTSSPAATVVATDVDGDSVSLTLGGSDAAAFQLDAATGELRFVSAPDFESPADIDGDNVYELTVTASDGAGASVSVPINIAVTDANDAPYIASGEFFGVQGLPGALGTLSVGDPDVADQLSISILGGAGSEFFSIDPQSGELVQAADARAGIYTLQVEVSDGRGGTATGTLTIRLDPLEAIAGDPATQDPAVPAPAGSDARPPRLADAIDGAPAAERSGTPDDQGAAAESDGTGDASTETGSNLPAGAGASRDAAAVRAPSAASALPGAADAPPSNQTAPYGASPRAMVLDLLLEETDELVEAALSRAFGDAGMREVSFSLSPAMLSALDHMREGFEQVDQEAERQQRLVAATGTVATLTLTAGFVTWLVRSGMLMTTLMSTAPVWRPFDPIPVLAPSTEPAGHNDDDGDDEV